MPKEVKIEIPDELYEEIENFRKSKNFKTIEEAILYLIRLGLSLILGIWIYERGIKPEEIRKKIFPEGLPEPHPYWPRII